MSRDSSQSLRSYPIACVRNMGLYEMLRRERARFILGTGRAAA